MTIVGCIYIKNKLMYNAISIIKEDNITQVYHVKNNKTKEEFREEIYQPQMKDQVLNAVYLYQHIYLDQTKTKQEFKSSLYHSSVI